MLKENIGYKLKVLFYLRKRSKVKIYLFILTGTITGLN